MSAGYIWAIKVESLGDGAAVGPTDTRTRWATRKPDWDTVGLYHACMVELPHEIRTEVDFVKGQSTIGGQTISLRKTPTVAGAFCRSKWRPIATLSADITKTATSITLSKAGLGGRDIALSRECIHITGAGPTYTAVRGVLGTRAAAHTADPTNDIVVFDASEGHKLADRIVTIVKVPEVGGGYDAEEVWWQGVYAKASKPSTLQVDITINSILSLLRRRRFCRQLWVGQGTPMMTTRGNDSAYFGKPYPGGLEDGDTAIVMLGSDTAVRAKVYGARAGLIGIYTDRISTGDENSTDVVRGCPPLPDQPAQQARELRSTIEDNPDGYSSNPFELCLELLMSTDAGDNYDSDGGATNRDKGLADRGADIPWEFVDVDSFERLRVENAFVAKHNRHFWGQDGPVGVFDAIESVLRVHGCVLVGTDTGQIGVVQFRDSAALSTLESIGPGDCIEPPEWVDADASLFDTVDIEFNDRPGIGPVVRQFEDHFNARRLIDGGGAATIDARGIEDQGAAEAFSLAFIQRYHWPIPATTLRLKPTKKLTLAQLVKVTHHQIPNPDTGLDGVTDLIGIVRIMIRSPRDKNHRYHIQLVGAAYNRTGTWSPSAEVVSYSAPTATIKANEFTDVDNIEVGTDGDAFASAIATAGGTLPITVCDSGFSIRGTGNASGATSTTLALSGLTVDPSPGDIIVIGDATRQGDAIKAEYAFLADSDGEVDGQPGYEWGW